MLICIDIGNTNLTIGAYENDFVKSWRIKTIEFNYDDLIKSIGDNGINEITGIAVSSVVPKITEMVNQLKTDYSNIPVVFCGDEKVDKIISIPFDNARDVGEDIIMNGIAVTEICDGGALVVDFGTATTFDVFNNKQFCGTSIATGVNLSLKALTDNASLLPEIKIEPTEKVICNTTTECMQSGIFWGYLNMVNGMIDQIKAELDFEITVYATGGLAELFTKYSEKIQYVENNLTLNGLKILFERNKHLYE